LNAYILYTIERKRLVEMKEEFFIEKINFIKILEGFRMNEGMIYDLHKDSYELMNTSNRW